MMIEDDDDNGGSDDDDDDDDGPSKVYKEVSGCVMIGKTFHCTSLAKIMFFNLRENIPKNANH